MRSWIRNTLPISRSAHAKVSCVSCHNRPTHVYDSLAQVVDFGLYSKKLDPDIGGMREDSFAVLKTEYKSRDEATERIVEDLLERMAQRHDSDFVARFEEEIRRSGTFLLEAYLNNVWPRMHVTWGTY